MKSTRYCAFCGRPEADCKALFQGLNGELLCDECIRAMAADLDGHPEGPAEAPKPVEKPLPTPKDLYELLDGYVIGQERAKRTLSVAVYTITSAYAAATPKRMMRQAPSSFRSRMCF